MTLFLMPAIIQIMIKQTISTYLQLIKSSSLWFMLKYPLESVQNLLPLQGLLQIPCAGRNHHQRV